MTCVFLGFFDSLKRTVKTVRFFACKKLGFLALPLGELACVSMTEGVSFRAL